LAFLVKTFPSRVICKRVLEDLLGTGAWMGVGFPKEKREQVENGFTMVSLGELARKVWPQILPE
jgi:hypothetical protein